MLPLVKNRMSPSQFAYVSRPGAGTTPAVTILSHEVLKFLDGKSGAVRLLSIDFAKAFDQVTHSAIVDACFTFEFDPHLIKWIVSFLSNRLQRVCLDGNVSSWSAVTSGVPQGSVLGPLLFCLVIDNLSPVFSNSSIIKYADDVMILHFIRDHKDDNLQAEWNALVEWSETLSLPINYSKSQVLDIVTKSSLSLSPISVSSTDFLKNVNSIVFLGVVVSGDLKWNLHFDKMLKKAAKRIFILRNLRRSECPQNIMWRVYSSMIRPLLTYAVPSFCNAPAYFFESLLRFERRLCRMMGIDPADQPSVIDVINVSCEKLFMQIHDNVNHSMRSMFLPHTYSSSRSVLKLRPPFARTKRFKSSFIRYCRPTCK